MNTKNTYTLMDGKGIPLERLTILNECYNQFSLNLLKQIDLSGKTVLEVACGIGLFTCELAKLVGKNGKVIATDISKEQLEIGKKHAREQDLHNIEFIECSAFELDSLKIKCDCVYSRFLLVHVQSPISVLKQELNCLKLGGYLICGEMCSTYKTMFCYPKSKTFDQIKKIHLLQTKIHNTDFSIGAKIPYILRELGTSLVYSHIGQPVLTTPREKKQLRLAMMEFAKPLISKRLATKQGIEQLSKDLKLFEHENHIATFATSMETCVKKIHD